MVFKIESFDKTTDLYLVSSNTNESKYVTSMQIIQVMLQGYKFVNCKLTNKGFAILTNSGTRYVQVNNIPKNIQQALHKAVESQNKEIKAKEIAKKQPANTHSASKPQNLRVKIQDSNGSSGNTPTARVKFKGKLPKHSIYGSVSFRGKAYKSDELLCKDYNRDCNIYREMIKQGYNIEEALGLCEPRSAKDLAADRRRAANILDSLARARGEY